MHVLARNVATGLNRRDRRALIFSYVEEYDVRSLHSRWSVEI